MCQCKLDLPKNCYVFVRASPGRRIRLVTQGRNGFLLTAIDHADLADGEARMRVNALNSGRGVNPDTAERMRKLAVSGWSQPGNGERLLA